MTRRRWQCRLEWYGGMFGARLSREKDIGRNGRVRQQGEHMQV